MFRTVSSNETSRAAMKVLDVMLYVGVSFRRCLGKSQCLPLYDQAAAAEAAEDTEETA